MRTMDERIERKLAAQGVDIQSDEGAQKLQREIERSIQCQSAQTGGLFKPSDFRKTERVGGIRI